jgi:cytochrome c
MIKSVLSSALALAALAATPALAAGDPAHGKQLFQNRCGACHAGAPDDGGGESAPNLNGVVGRKAGSLPGFGYTPALKAYGQTWTPDLLQTFLAGPSKLVPGTAMPIAVPKAQDRADLVAYLGTLKK